MVFRVVCFIVCFVAMFGVMVHLDKGNYGTAGLMAVIAFVMAAFVLDGGGR